MILDAITRVLNTLDVTRSKNRHKRHLFTTRHTTQKQFPIASLAALSQRKCCYINH